MANYRDNPGYQEFQGYDPTATDWMVQTRNGERQNYGIDSTTRFTPESAAAHLAAVNANPVVDTFTRYGMGSSMGGVYNPPHSWNSNYRLGDVDIAEQAEKPASPGVRQVVANTYGAPIPISGGRRRVPGVILLSTDIVPELVGTFEYEVQYQVPIYDDQEEPDNGTTSFEVEDRPRPNPSDPPANNCGGDPCNPRSLPPSDPIDPEEPDPGEGDLVFKGWGTPSQSDFPLSLPASKNFNDDPDFAYPPEVAGYNTLVGQLQSNVCAGSGDGKGAIYKFVDGATTGTKVWSCP